MFLITLSKETLALYLNKMIFIKTFIATFGMAILIQSKGFYLFKTIGKFIIILNVFILRMW